MVLHARFLVILFFHIRPLDAMHLSDSPSMIFMDRAMIETTTRWGSHIFPWWSGIYICRCATLSGRWVRTTQPRVMRSRGLQSGTSWTSGIPTNVWRTSVVWSLQRCSQLSCRGRRVLNSTDYIDTITSWRNLINSGNRFMVEWAFETLAFEHCENIVKERHH